MPKVKYTMSVEEKRENLVETKTKRLCEDVRAAVFEIRGRNNLTQGEFAEMAGLNSSTFSKRLKNPKDFEFGEFVKILVTFPEIREKIANSISTL